MGTRAGPHVRLQRDALARRAPPAARSTSASSPATGGRSPRSSTTAELAGLSEEAIIGGWLGVDGPLLASLVAERIDAYAAEAADGATVTGAVRDAVRYAAARVPVAIVSGAFRAEIEPVIAAAGIAGELTAIVAADDVEHGKPHPEGYLRALERLGVDAGRGGRASRTPRRASPRPRPRGSGAWPSAGRCPTNGSAGPTSSSTGSTSRSSNGSSRDRHRAPRCVARRAREHARRVRARDRCWRRLRRVRRSGFE